ncbi:hypothetical protein GUR46_18455 [Stenotrophomonas maltophilia]|uniref:hypothetical protein n=1 Tax=Stenotrophomonas maltophilia TaxID=40324 RepID=UPI001F304F0C|nr:hypothetical protein [Stenotrophomonas maltophilia]MCF3530857.1 hypothetical protein [Stenotrophomonas maltophilia]MCF3534741.1 hypothetical protein [Stenotrophomonas maltophilia]
MASNNGHTPVLPGPMDRGDQVISLADYLRLCRIADAAALLAKLPSEAAKMLDIKADHTSAVAQYMAEDLAAILSRSRPADE